MTHPSSYSPAAFFSLLIPSSLRSASARRPPPAARSGPPPPPAIALHPFSSTCRFDASFLIGFLLVHLFLFGPFALPRSSNCRYFAFFPNISFSGANDVFVKGCLQPPTPRPLPPLDLSLAEGALSAERRESLDVCENPMISHLLRRRRPTSPARWQRANGRAARVHEYLLDNRERRSPIDFIFHGFADTWNRTNSRLPRFDLMYSTGSSNQAKSTRTLITSGEKEL